MKATIERIDNAYVCKGDSDGGKYRMAFEFDENEGDKSEMDAFTRALWEIKNMLGYYPSKHSDVHLVIDVDEDGKPCCTCGKPEPASPIPMPSDGELRTLATELGLHGLSRCPSCQCMTKSRCAKCDALK